MAAALVVLAAAAQSGARSGVLDLSPADHVLRVRQDALDLHTSVRRSAWLVDALLAGPADEGAGRELFATIVDHLAAIDAVQAFHGSFPAEAMGGRETGQVESFLVAYSARLALWTRGRTLAHWAAAHPGLATTLNLADPGRGLPAGTLDAIVGSATGPGAGDFVAQGYGFHVTHRESLRTRRVDRERAMAWMMPFVEKGARAATEHMGGNISSVRPKRSVAGLRGLFEPIFTGTTRASDAGLISMAQVDRLLAQLQPGDVILTRRKADPSTAGLPGRWTSAALFMGRPTDWLSFLRGDADSTSFFRKRGAPDGRITVYVGRRFPVAWALMLRGESEPHSTGIALLGPSGVALQPITNLTAADEVAVLRPRVPKVWVARALSLGLHYHGYPRNWDSDLTAPGAMSGAELIFRAYGGGDEEEGYEFPTRTHLGRPQFPANDLAAWYSRTAEIPDSPWAFVTYLQARPGATKATRSTERAFRASAALPKWGVGSFIIK